jgi:hypothetical protein
VERGFLYAADLDDQGRSNELDLDNIAAAFTFINTCFPHARDGFSKASQPDYK